MDESENSQRFHMTAEHCIYSWNIENATGEIKDAMWITSPSFSLGAAQFSTWDIRFYPMIKMGESRAMGFLLRRTGRGAEPETLFVSFRFGITNSSENKIWLQEYKKVLFKKLDSKLHGTTLVGHVEDFLSNCENDTMTVLCEMYVGSINILNDNDNTLDWTRRINDLRCLSEDMTKIFTSCNHPEMLLKVADKNYHVHRSILAARSKVFAKMLRGGSRYLAYLDIDQSIMSTLLYFLYSGNLSKSFFKNHLAIGLYECAKTLDICGLDKFLVPNRIFAMTSTYTEECEFIWSVESFTIQELKIGQFIKSPEFSTSIETGCVWYMVVYPRGVQPEPEKVVIAVQPCMQSYEAIFMTVTISILDSKGQHRYVKCQKKFVFSGITFVFPPLLRTSVLKSYKNDLLPDDVLTIHCKVRVLNADHLLHNMFVARTTDGDRSNFERLSHDLQTLFEKEELNDFELKFGERKLKAHLAILLARSSIIDSLWVIERRKLDISEFDANVFQKMLFYLYTGKFKRLNYQEAMDLLRMARIYHIPSLRAKCRQILKSCLSVDIVFDVLLFAHGNRREESELKNACLEYIRDNAEVAFDHSSWNFMKDWEPNLSQEITDFCNGVSFTEKVSRGFRGYINEVLLFSMLMATIFMLKRSLQFD